jgi:hypothetical protein
LVFAAEKTFALVGGQLAQLLGGFIAQQFNGLLQMLLPGLLLLTAAQPKAN